MKGLKSKNKIQYRFTDHFYFTQSFFFKYFVKFSNKNFYSYKILIQKNNFYYSFYNFLHKTLIPLSLYKGAVKITNYNFFETVKILLKKNILLSFTTDQKILNN